MVTQTYNIIVTTTGTAQAGQQIRNIGAQAKRANHFLGFLRAGLVVMASVAVISRLAKLADSFTEIQNRLRIVTTGTRQLNLVTEELFAIANRTRLSFEATATVFARTAIATRDLGFAQQDVLDFTEGLNKAIIVSGATAQEANAAMIQLSQGMASGTLRGDELRSVLEQLPFVARLIAREVPNLAGGFGIAFGEIRAYAQAGLITTEIVARGILNNLDEIDRLFRQTVVTITQAFQVLGNEATRVFQEFNTGHGITQSVAQAILFLASNVETLARAFAFLAIVISVNLTKALAGMLLRLTFMGGALGLVVGALTAVIALTVTFGDKIRLSEKRLATLQDLGLAVWNSLKQGVLDLADVIGVDLTISLDTFKEAWIELVIFMGAVLDRVLIGPSGTVALFQEDVNFITEQINAFVSMFNADPDSFIGRLQANPLVIDTTFQVTNIEDYIRSVTDAAEEIAVASNRRLQQFARYEGRFPPQLSLGGDGGVPASEGSGDGKPDDTFKRNLGVSGREVETFRNLLKNLELEGNLLSMVTREREIMNGVLQVEDQLKRKLTETELERLDAQLRLNQALQEESTLYDSIRAPLETYMTSTAALIRLYEKGKITLEEFTQQTRDYRIAFLETQTDASSGVERFALNFQKDMDDSASAVEGLLGDAFRSAEDAFIDFVTTGKIEFSSFADSILADLTRIAFKAAILQPISDFLLGGGIGDLFGGSGKVSKGGSGGGLVDIFGALGGLLGFAHGGSFNVGGAGGVDSQVVAFRATPGERVQVNTPAQSMAQGGNQYHFHITTPDVEGFKRSQGQIAMMTRVTLERAGRRNGRS